MDTVKALNTYRKSIASDERAFEVLCFLYQKARASEEDLHNWTGIKIPSLKATIRELYQADFLKSSSGNLFALTQLAETALSEMEVDKLVISLLVNEVGSKSEAKKFSHFVDWVWLIEPERRQSTVYYLRNLKTFLAAQPNVGIKDRKTLLWMCAVHPDSRTRLVLKSDLTSVNSQLIGSEESNLWLDAVQSANHAAAELEKIDSILARTCTNDISRSSLPDSVVDLITFRYFNYALSPDRDHVLETYHSRFSAHGRALLQDSILRRFPSVAWSIDLIEHAGSALEKSQIKESFFAIIDRITSVKIKARLDISFSIDRLRKFEIRADVQMPTATRKKRSTKKSSGNQLTVRKKRRKGASPA